MSGFFHLEGELIFAYGFSRVALWSSSVGWLLTISELNGWPMSVLSLGVPVSGFSSVFWTSVYRVGYDTPTALSLVSFFILTYFVAKARLVVYAVDSSPVCGSSCNYSVLFSSALC